MTTLRRVANKVFNREAALFVGAVASGVLFFIEQISGPGIFVDDPMQTLLNLIPILIPAISGAVTRYRVYSIVTTAKLVGVTPTELARMEPPP